MLCFNFGITTFPKMSSAQLRENFFKVAERVESLSGIIDPSNPQSLIYAQKVCILIVLNEILMFHGS